MSDAGISLPKPLPALNGDMIVTLPGGRLATLVSWVAGANFAEYGEALAGTSADQKLLFARIGLALARLHNVTDNLVLPDGFSRHAWDSAGLLGDSPFWGRFWQNPTLNNDEAALVQRARAVARDRLAVFVENGADYGLIHADVLRGNVFVDGEQVTLIDFDDCGFGFRIYEFATLMSQNEGLENSAELQAAAIAGYRNERALSREAEELLPMFIMLRRLASMGWIVPRANGEIRQMRYYADKALPAVRRFLT